MAKNPLKELVKMYTDQVKKADRIGYAKIFKKCTEVFFRCVNEDLEPSTELRFHFTDISFRDGYYIFGFGTNSVVHFHVAECPGWLFGIWWSTPDEDDVNKYITGEIFAQYEETLDKFKPSRSPFRETIRVSKGEKGEYTECFTLLAEQIFEFIHKEPYLAFCRDFCFWDYNREFHSREEAAAKYIEYCEQREKTKKYTEICDTRVLEFVREKILPCFNEATIKDLGENMSPRYEVRAPLKKNKHLVDERGFYSFFADDDEKGKIIMDEFDAVIEECRQMADANGVCWYCPIDYSIYYYK